MRASEPGLSALATIRLRRRWGQRGASEDGSLNGNTATAFGGQDSKLPKSFFTVAAKVGDVSPGARDGADCKTPHPQGGGEAYKQPADELLSSNRLHAGVRAYAHFFPSESRPARPRSSGVIATRNSTSALNVRNHGSASTGTSDGSFTFTTKVPPRLPWRSEK